MGRDWIIAAHMEHQPLEDGGSCHYSTCELFEFPATCWTEYAALT
jgi:hypothetical protein